MSAFSLGSALPRLSQLRRQHITFRSARSARMKHKAWGELLQVRTASSIASCQGSVVIGRSNLDNDDNDEEDDDPGREMQRQREAEKDRRYNVIHTALVCLASFACGMAACQRGPTILALGHLLATDLQHAASLFALGAGGQLAGCLAIGVALGRFRTPMILFWALVGLGASTAALPWCRSYGLMAVLYFFSLFFVGCVETGSYVDVAKRWGTNGGRILQFLQLSFVAGGVISPALTHFFLSSKHYPLADATKRSGSIAPGYNASQTTLGDFAASAAWNSASTLSPVVFSRAARNVSPSSVLATASTLEGSLANRTTNATDFMAAFLQADSQVAYAYAISAAVAFAVALSLAAGHLTRRQKEINATEAGSLPRRHRERTLKMLPVLAAVACFFFALCGVEETFQQFLAAFLVEDQHWVPSAASLLTSWFWCGVMLVRLASLLMPAFVHGEEQRATLALSCSLLPACLLALHLTAARGWRDAVWACVFFVGMATSNLFPAAFTWLHGAFPALSPGAVSGVVILSTALAGVVNPLVLGHLFQRRAAGSKTGPGGFCFLLLAQSCLVLLAYVALRLLAVSRRRSSSSSPTYSSTSAAKRSKVNNQEEEDDELVLEIQVPSRHFDELHEPVDIEDVNYK